MTAAERSPQDAALAYADAGWPVFPVAPGGKAPALPAAHPPGDPAAAACQGECGRDGHGFRDATTDPGKIREWWGGGHAGRNVGIATGAPGPDVVDVDVREDGSGFAALNRAQARGPGRRLPRGRADPVARPAPVLRRAPSSATGRSAASTSTSARRAATSSPRRARPRRAGMWSSSTSPPPAPPSRGRPSAACWTRSRSASRATAPASPAATHRAPAWTGSLTGSRAGSAGDRNFPLFYAAKQAALAGPAGRRRRGAPRGRLAALGPSRRRARGPAHDRQRSARRRPGGLPRPPFRPAAAEGTGGGLT